MMRVRNAVLSAVVLTALISATCSYPTTRDSESNGVRIPAPTQSPIPTSPTPAIPNLQAELLDDRDKTTESPLGDFDFKNYTYELPRGWQNPDGTNEFTLINGRVAPIGGSTSDEMSDEEKAAVRAERRIGMSFVTAKFFDVSGDGRDEAVVILKVETGGAAIPQIAYVFAWENGAPKLLWPFRTGDRADGGLKDVRSENGELVVELFGQDRFLLGQTETGKITGDEEQLCCPTFFTRSFYKWNGTAFLMQRKRLTYSMTDKNAPPIENKADIINKENQNARGNGRRQ